MAENIAATPYTPLPSNDSSAIRLVKVLPVGFDDPVQCELETMSLANKPPYIALSYVWGDATDTVPISLIGVEHGVTRNLNSFLRHLQALLKEVFLVLQSLSVHDWPSGLQIVEALNQQNSQDIGKTAEQDSQDLRETAQAAVLSYFASMDDQGAIDRIRMQTSRSIQITQWNDWSLPRFWIDALCINQNDLVERNKQVNRMNHIYRQTCLLFVWALNHQQQPGQTAVLAHIVFRDIELVCRKLAHLEPESSPITHESDVTNAVRRLLSSQLMCDILLARNIARFFELEWFCRGWVFQEVALSASKPSELWVGYKHISLSRLLVAGIVIFEVSAKLEHKNHLIREDCESKASGTLLALRMEKNLVDLGQDSLHSVSPTSNLSICRRLIYILSAGHLRFKVTDPRDAIYSLYGLLSTSRLPAMIEPDYNQSVSVVYHSIASYLLSHMGIDILGFFLSSLGGMDGCPSWVPDFSCLQRYDTLYQQYPAVGMKYKHMIKDEILSIEEGPPQDLTAAHESELSPSFLRISCPIYWLQTIKAVIRLDGNWEYPQPEGRESPYDTELKRRPLIAAVSLIVLNSIHYVIQGDKNADVKAWIQFLERFAGQILFDPWAHEILLEEIVDVLVELRFIPMVEGILHGYLGITEDGHLILGMRRHRLQEHDRIGFIPNSLNTFIFRPCDSGYRFITKCSQSDAAELVEVESLQLGDKEIVTII